MIKRFLLLISAIILLSACQDNGPQYDEPVTDVVLTVLAREVYSQVLRLAENSMAAEWAADGRDFRLELVSYSPLDREAQLTSLQVQLMAGQGPDLLFWDGTPVWIHQASGFFADINELMERNPNTNRDDFYSHVLDAWEFDGGLYIFPLSFEFDAVGISYNLPQSIIDRFYGHSNISIHEMLQMYLYLLNEYPEYSHMDIAPSFF